MTTFADSALPASLRGTRHVALNITKRCNQRCVFCFEGTRSSWEEPDFDEVRRLLEAVAAGHDRVVFMGAEALLRDDILDVLRLTHSLGLSASVFTNGQVLARDGFVGELAEAGLGALEVSCHYADADSFARGTGTRASMFDRLLGGLRQLRQYNRQATGRRINVSIETDLFLLNAGKLVAIRDLLDDVLAESFVTHRIGVVQPFSCPSSDEPMLEPLAERRAELVHFLETNPPAREVCLAKMPLCLAPGWEHLSLDVRYKLEDTKVLSNFDDKSWLGRMHHYDREFSAGPYRWLCRDCNLLPICWTQRTSWRSVGHQPTRAQRPIPEHSVTVRDVLARLADDGEIPETVLERGRVFWRSLPLPDADLIAAIRSSDDPSVRVEDVYCERHPIADVELVVEGVQLQLRLSPVESAGHGALVKFLRADIIEPAEVPAQVGLRVLRWLAAVPFPAIQEWSTYQVVDFAVARAAWTVWSVFGGRVWPGVSLGLGWITHSFAVDGQFFRWRVRKGQATADLLLAAEDFRALNAPAVTTLLVDGPSLRVWLTPSVDPAASHELAEIFDGVARRSGETVEDGMAVERPVAPRVNGAERARTGYSSRPGTLCVTFVDRDGGAEPLVFLVAHVRDGDRFFRRVGDTGLSYQSSPTLDVDDQHFRACAQALLRAMEGASGPPGTVPVDRWREWIESAATRLGPRIEVALEETGS